MLSTNNDVPTLGVCPSHRIQRLDRAQSVILRVCWVKTPAVVASTTARTTAGKLIQSGKDALAAKVTSTATIMASITSAYSSQTSLLCNFSTDTNQLSGGTRRSSMNSQPGRGNGCSLNNIKSQSQLNDFSNGGGE